MYVEILIVIRRLDTLLTYVVKLFYTLSRILEIFRNEEINPESSRSKRYTNKDDSFWNEAEMFRNIASTGISRNRLPLLILRLTVIDLTWDIKIIVILVKS